MAHPTLHDPDDLFVRFYGNQAQHCIAPYQVEDELQRWVRAVAQGLALPGDLARFHWCCILRRQPRVALRAPERCAAKFHGDVEALIG